MPTLLRCPSKKLSVIERRGRDALWTVAALLALKSVLASFSNPQSDPVVSLVIYAPFACRP
jgi:hypothetical protein